MSYEPTFKPSDVRLDGIPLVNSMGRVEREAAATLIVRACQRFGDRWQPLTMKQLGHVPRASRLGKREEVL